MIYRQPDKEFQLVSDYQPTGDQPEAIAALTKGVEEGDHAQILLGATGTGKTFTISNVIKNVNRPTLILSHNKTLAGQLYGEMKKFFPNNAVEYFVSYYDYYQPEAYVPSSDTYIEKDASINDEIDQLRHSATSSLIERNDVIVVASVSSIFGLGSPAEYQNHVVSLRVGQEIPRNRLLRELVEIQFDRNDIDFQRGRFRVRGDVVEIFPASREEKAIRVEFFGDEIDRIREVDALTGEVIGDREHVSIFPATHFLTSEDIMDLALPEIEADMKSQVAKFTKEGKLLEAQRLQQRTTYDIEMMREMGYTNGIENYSRYMDRRKPGEPPFTLLDFFPKDFLLIVDESHQTMPQVRGMYNGDRARKQQLIDYGFRLPSALDNRPLTLKEFEGHVHQVIYMSATPGPYEEAQTDRVVQQIIRPTGLLDPTIEVRPVMGQIDDLVGEINKRIEKNERVLVTTLTKKMSEDLSDYLKDLGLKVKYLHSDIKTLERTQIIRDLRLGKFDVLVGINLLREGLDIPEVSLVAILDADKEGFLRNERSLIQTIGRAARNANGSVIMYADTVTDSMRAAIDETKRRRTIQEAYNKEHGITPKTIIKPIQEAITAVKPVEDEQADKGAEFTSKDFAALDKEAQAQMIAELTEQMKAAAKRLDFEQAATLRDTVMELTSRMKKK
ncbi:excinuclease ABC subunit UvrB [Limosilactobacillus fermentum]|uniref:UvrABC system protein B n=1 Tax=Limosilactobacillus fermentum TaxID=1613 RepID=A0AAJ4KWC4_LIMFE|nr:excinuclease ABC subunit UvrB [Limosilactobacillus fermentum]MCZ2327543.1 excinuclease ABC subunit UvrB [Limosilactobacillus fermentum]OFT09292.1 excinuclease ABC subunit B [Lactobacillus sp. HMSC24D01]QIX58000.1 UvrABC system protein B [Limosilactobacillus fermentum]